MIFVVGNSRSGTTMVSGCFANHSQVYRFNELHFYEGVIADPTKYLSKSDAVIALSKLFWKEYEEFLSHIDVEKYKPLAEELLIDWDDSIVPHRLFSFYLNYVTTKKGKQIACEQTPRNIYFAKEILDNYPDAVVVNMVRDPRPIMLSQKNKWKIRKIQDLDVPFLNSIRLFFNYHPYLVTKFWKSAIRAGLECEEEDRFITIKYEDFLHSPENYLRKVCDLIGVDFQNKMLEVDNHASSFKEDHGKKGFDTSKIDKWKKSNLRNSEITVCERLAREELLHYNYEILNRRTNIFALWFTYLVLPVKLSMAFILNLSRNKNIFKTFRRRFFNAK